LAIHVGFDKERAELVLDCVHRGAPIPPRSDEGWSVDDALMTAAALMWCAQYAAPTANYDGERISPELAEARATTIITDIGAVLGFYAKLISMMRAGEYDRHYEPEIEGVLRVGDSGPDMVLTRGARG